MKKLIHLLFLVLFFATVNGQTTISSLSAASSTLSMLNGTYRKIIGQSFQPSSSYVLDSARVRLKMDNTGGTGNVYMSIYNHTGTFGSGGTGTGTALAQSGTIDASTISSATATWYTFIFTGDNAITLTSGSTYVVAIFYGGSSVILRCYYSTTTSSHAGNMSGMTTTTWSSVSGDMGHYVFGHSASTTAVKAINGVTQATVSKLAGVTMSGVKKFNGVANQ